MGIMLFAFILLLMLKITGLATMSWWIVFLPVLFYPVGLLIVFSFLIMIACIESVL